MATERRIEVRFVVDRIQFEQAGNNRCLCGNSHQEAAMGAWTGHFYQHLGVDGEIAHGNDHSKHDVYVSESWREADEEGEGEWESREWWPHGEKLVCSYDDSPVAPADVVAAWRAAEEVERTAWDAAWQAADDDCGTTDEERANDECADYWLGEMRRTESERAHAARVAETIAALTPDMRELATETAARLTGASRSTRKRAWRMLRAKIGPEATARLQAAVTVFSRPR